MCFLFVFLCFNDVPQLFQKSTPNVPNMFQKCVKNDPQMSHKCFKMSQTCSVIILFIVSDYSGVKNRTRCKKTELDPSRKHISSTKKKEKGDRKSRRKQIIPQKCCKICDWAIYTLYIYIYIYVSIYSW